MSKKDKTDVVGSTMPLPLIEAIDKEVTRLSNIPGVSTSRSALIAGAVEMRVKWREIRDATGELVALVKPGVVEIAFTGMTAREPILKDGEHDGEN